MTLALAAMMHIFTQIQKNAAMIVQAATIHTQAIQLISAPLAAQTVWNARPPQTTALNAPMAGTLIETTLANQTA